MITFVNSKKQIKTCSLNSDIENSDPSLFKRLQYAKEVLVQMLNKNHQTSNTATGNILEATQGSTCTNGLLTASQSTANVVFTSTVTSKQSVLETNNAGRSSQKYPTILKSARNCAESSATKSKYYTSCQTSANKSHNIKSKYSGNYSTV